MSVNLQAKFKYSHCYTAHGHNGPANIVYDLNGWIRSSFICRIATRYGAGRSTFTFIPIYEIESHTQISYSSTKTVEKSILLLVSSWDSQHYERTSNSGKTITTSYKLDRKKSKFTNRNLLMNFEDVIRKEILYKMTSYIILCSSWKRDKGDFYKPPRIPT